MAHAAKAKVMMGNVNKTDKLDARGLTTLLRNGTLPIVWIALGEIRDKRELPRTRMALCKIRVSCKNRNHATLEKYILSFEGKEGSSDIFSNRFALTLEQKLQTLPTETQKCIYQELALPEELLMQIGVMEDRNRERIPMKSVADFIGMRTSHRITEKSPRSRRYPWNCNRFRDRYN